MKRLFVWALFCSFASLAARAAEPGRLVLVLELRDKLKGPDRPRVHASYLADVVRAAARDAAPRLRVTTHEDIESIAAGQGRKLEELADKSEVEAARLLSSDFVISGVIEAASGQVLSGVSATGATADEVGKAATSAVAKLLVPVKDLRDPGAPMVGGSCRTVLCLRAVLFSPKETSSLHAIARRRWPPMPGPRRRSISEVI